MVSVMVSVFGAEHIDPTRYMVSVYIASKFVTINGVNIFYQKCGANFSNKKISKSELGFRFWTFFVQPKMSNFQNPKKVLKKGVKNCAANHYALKNFFESEIFVTIKILILFAGFFLFPF